MQRLLSPGLVLWVLVGPVVSGCAISNLKEANRRLKESNDRLLSENNRLDGELALARQELDALREGVAPPRSPEETIASANLPASASRPSAAASLLIPDTAADGIEVDETPLGIRLTVPHRVFFASGQAKLSSRGEEVLQRIARILNQPEYTGNLVRVDGHTDDVPVRKVRHIYPTNWELSAARACTVVRYLVERAGVRSERIYPAGFAHTRPVANGRSAQDRQKNRRVEITILNQRV